MASVPFVLFIAAWCLLIVKLYLDHQKRHRLPDGAKPLPGPKSIPFIGRVHDLPPDMTWMKFYEWSKIYGPIYQMEIFGSVHIWMSSEEIVQDLLARRANINSDRPVIVNLPDNRTSGDYLALSGNNETWKRQRKMCNQLMAASNKQGLHAYPTRERDRFLSLMANDPSNYIEWIEQFTARTVSRVCWGTPHRQALLRKTTFGLLESISPAGALPNVVAWLGYLPDKFSPWRKKEHLRHALEAELFTSNLAGVKASMNEGHSVPSAARTFLEDMEQKPRGSQAEADFHSAEGSKVVGMMAIAGALTIGSPIQSFLLAMCHYPEWLERMQAEIDINLDGRCPQWDDREKLPLLRAVVKETMRWRPPVPTGIPHASDKDDVYNGYFIPKGATLHALEWGLTRDESVYPDAETFNPDRWLNPSFPTYKEPLTHYPNLNGYSQFGYGRRTCQGIPIVDQDLFLSMGGLAWAFDIRKKLDTQGNEIPVHWNSYSSLLIAKPVKFEFDCVPREGKGRVIDLMASSAREMEEEENRLLGYGCSTGTSLLHPRVEISLAKDIEVMSEVGSASASDSDESSMRDSLLLSSEGSSRSSSVYSSDSEEGARNRKPTKPLKKAASAFFGALPGGWV
ncbi:hypothetical protein MCOR02_011769 [Pyricularia oryzae]|nr:hypothetical protein OOU_Y34scaffold00734g8 [Pyricularia oryzae Y34]KAH9428284.1 hypothetical protein MCOR02_011769 [Pyricularia oryzae]KAI6306073.1 hypothetical protein MCOR34_008208 [Pyricularia oryzae]KAI6414101.1 hypothetical protein MCOR21_011634 [Pyricularia oryzae]KAI6464762.1 hypothetical protein MCOR17_005225 [Pyricularia oryzae]